MKEQRCYYEKNCNDSFGCRNRRADSGGCKLDGETTGFKTQGTYKLNEAEKTLTVNMEGRSDEKNYSYELTDTTLNLKEKYSSYHLVKQ